MHIYMVGMKGVAMTSLALCYADQGHDVRGSDVAESFVTQAVLDAHHFHIFHGFTPDHITSEIDLVVYTGAHQGKQNVEVQAARTLGIPVQSHAQALGELIARKRVISVCGTGGKSTTSAMIAWILARAGHDPSFAIGVGNVPDFGIPGRWVADSQWFVAEADEYAVDPTDDHRPRFIYQHPEIIVCTNLKYDHPDVYPNFSRMRETFLTFFNTLPAKGVLIINGDDPVLSELVTQVRSEVRVIAVSLDTDHEIKLRAPGAHNQRNARMAIEVARVCGVDREIAETAVQDFSGTMRRFELKGQINGADWYDDYAHTPDEIRATLHAIRTQCPGKKLIALFQPHTYSRTSALFDDFSQSLTNTDELILLDIFASAREKKDETISSEKLKVAIQKLMPKLDVKNMKTIGQAADYLRNYVDESMVVLSMGAGDVYKVYEQI